MVFNDSHYYQGAMSIVALAGEEHSHGVGSFQAKLQPRQVEDTKVPLYIVHCSGMYSAAPDD